MSEKAVKWKNQKEGFLEALRYVRGRQEGVITSFKTPWRRFNDATTDGLEWGTITVIGGRPGTGKTLVKDQLIREGIKLNCTKEEYDSARFPFRVLEFQFEMMARTSSLREFSSVLGKTYKYVCSADGKITDEDIEKCFEYSKARVKYPIDIVEEPCTVTQFRSIVNDYMKTHATKDEDGKVSYINTIITLDHSMLLKKSSAERDKFETLYAFGETLTELKRKYPICFIILSQLNRNVDDPKRNEPGKFGNYVLDSDIFGADALLQHADTLIGLNRPMKNRINLYGPDKYIIDDDNIIAMHFLKCRNGDTRISFFRAEFYRMRLVEIPPPPMKEDRIKT